MQQKLFDIRNTNFTVSHPCAAHKGGCAHVCVTAYRGDGRAPHAQCLCQHGFRLVGHGDCEREYSSTSH